MWEAPPESFQDTEESSVGEWVHDLQELMSSVTSNSLSPVRPSFLLFLLCCCTAMGSAAADMMCPRTFTEEEGIVFVIIIICRTQSILRKSIPPPPSSSSPSPSPVRRRIILLPSPLLLRRRRRRRCRRLGFPCSPTAPATPSTGSPAGATGVLLSFGTSETIRPRMFPVSRSCGRGRGGNGSIDRRGWIDPPTEAVQLPFSASLRLTDPALRIQGVQPEHPAMTVPSHRALLSEFVFPGQPEETGRKKTLHDGFEDGQARFRCLRQDCFGSPLFLPMVLTEELRPFILLSRVCRCCVFFFRFYDDGPKRT